MIETVRVENYLIEANRVEDYIRIPRIKTEKQYAISPKIENLYIQNIRIEDSRLNG
jgi:hypothetical protein